MARNIGEISYSPAPLKWTWAPGLDFSMPLHAGNDDCLGSIGTRGTQLPWSRLNVLLPLQVLKNDKQTSREIKKSTFQALGKSDKHKLWYVSVWDWNRPTGDRPYSWQGALACTMHLPEIHLESLMWNPRDEVLEDKRKTCQTLAQWDDSGQELGCSCSPHV